MKKSLIFIFLVFTILTISGCTNSTDTVYEPTVYDGQFNTEEELLTLISDYKNALNTFSARNYLMTPDVAVDDAALESDTDSKNGDSGSDDYSDTNVQVEGVDEMDNVKTDGKYLYIVRNNKVSILLAYTNDLESDALSEVTELTYIHEPQDDTCGYSNTYISGLYVDDSRLVVITNTYSYTCLAVTTDKVDPDNPDGDVEYFEEYEYHYQNETTVYTYELDSFDLEDTYTLSGSLIGTRKIGDNLYVITRNYIRYNATYNEETEMYDYDYQISDSYPYFYNNDGETTTASVGQIIYEDGVNPDSFTAFYGINLEDNIVDMEVVLGDSGYNLYVSSENIYLVGVDYSYYWWRVYDVATDDVETNVDPSDNEIKTNIIKMSIDGVDISFGGRGQVSGRSLDQFSMDEYNGYLRITTTNQSWWWWGFEDGQPTVNNRLFILDENLDIVSSVENLGKPGEVIQSTRFSGPYAYVVTFEQTDPFYVINVEDPENPFVEGELEIPGFSTYLQPLNNDFILGIGFDADSEGRTTGLKLSVYDVSDKENPVVFDEIIFAYSDHGWAWSSSTYNHKDLIVDLNKGIVAFPMTMSSYIIDNNDNWSYSYETGIMIYNLSLEDGLSYSGYMTQSSDAEYYWNEYVYKGQFIGDYFYAISNQYVTVAKIDAVENELNRIVFSDVDDYYKEEYLID
jgi:inhibitor of cysteine peptidase